MYKSKLIDILKTFTKKELKRFSSYIESPFFNTKKEVGKLYEFIKNCYPNFEASALDKTKVFQEVFPNLSFKESKLRYVMTDLTKLLESFLMHEEYTTCKKKNTDLLLSIYKKRELDKHFKALLYNCRRESETKLQIDSNYYLTLHQLEEEVFIFNSLKQKNRPAKEIPMILGYLDDFYILQKLKYSCEVYSTRNHLGENYKNPILLNSVIEYVRINLDEQSPIIRIYYYVYMTLKEPSQKHYHDMLLKGLTKYEKIFNKKDVIDLYIYAKNYYYYKYLTEGVAYLLPFFKLYRENLEKNHLLINNCLSHSDYKNIVQLGLYFKELKFVEKFINDYKLHLKKEYQLDAYTYCLACLHFERKDYDSTIRLLNEVHLNSAIYHLSAKKILAQCYYDQKEYEALFFLINAVNKYIKLAKVISETYKQAFRNFFSLIGKLRKIKETLPLGNDKQLKRSTDKLKNEIEQIKTVGDWVWLSAKIEELGIE